MASQGTVGERIRAIRLQKRLSLHDVEVSSEKEFKASVLGAYERCERNISVPRLAQLARFFGVPVEQLLPRGEESRIELEPAQRGGEAGVCIDLIRLNEVRTPETEVLGRYVRSIQLARGDFNGRMLTVRGEDVRALAAVLETSADTLTGRLDELGLRIPQRA